MQKAFLLAVLFLLCQSRCTSQIVPVTPATVNAGGGSTAITQNFIVDWSIGESTLIDTYYGENTDSNAIAGRSWSVTSGILQPFDKTHVLFNPLIPTWTDQEIRIYPVPTHGIIFIEIRSAAIGKISIQLFSNDGKLLDIREFNLDNGNSIQKWNLTNRPAGVYHFQILLLDENGNLLKQGTFNIDKL
jgi:hypothetical protein